MEFKLDPLPYDYAALEPHISANTLHFHYDKHHQTYMDKLEAAIKDSPQASDSLEQIILNSEGGVFNSAAQVWNHTFYWHCMSPNGGGNPTGKLADRIQEDFGSIDAFVDAFAEAAKNQFGSGWAWLVAGPDGKLSVTSTSDAGNPMTTGHTPLLTIDVWEHAYYLDYQNARPKYVTTFMGKLVNWDFVAENMEKASQPSAA